MKSIFLVWAKVSPWAKVTPFDGTDVDAEGYLMKYIHGDFVVTIDSQIERQIDFLIIN